MQPWPVAYTYWHRREPAGSEPVRLIVHETKPIEEQGAAGEVLEARGDNLVVAAGEGAIRIVTIQREGKKPGPVAEFLRGNHVEPGDRMGDPPKSVSSV
jgi:methionyl-tRNA formyltransferase